MTGLKFDEFLKAKKALPENQIRRAAHEKARHAELDRILVLDVAYRSQLRSQPREPWDRDASSPEARELQDEADFDLRKSYRFLVHAVDGYLLHCAEISCVDGESVLEQVTSTDELIAMLQTEEDLMIATFGPPWEE